MIYELHNELLCLFLVKKLSTYLCTRVTFPLIEFSNNLGSASSPSSKPNPDTDKHPNFGGKIQTPQNRRRVTVTNGWTRHNRPKRGGEAVGGEIGGEHTLTQPRSSSKGRSFSLQQNLRIQLHHSRSTLSNALHLRPRSPHGA